jgi:hypothetical protein
LDTDALASVNCLLIFRSPRLIVLVASVTVWMASLQSHRVLGFIFGYDGEDGIEHWRKYFED